MSSQCKKPFKKGISIFPFSVLRYTRSLNNFETINLILIQPVPENHKKNSRKQLKIAY